MAALQFLYRHRVGWFSQPLSWARGHPDGDPSFVPPFGGFRLAGRFRPIFVSRRADAAVGNHTLWATAFGARSKRARTYLTQFNASRRLRKPGYVQQLSRVTGFTEVSLMRTALFITSSGRLLAGLAPVCFAPNLLSEFFAFNDVRPPPSTQVNCAFSALDLLVSLRPSDHRSDVQAESHRESVAFQRGQSNQPRLPFRPVLLGFILRVSCRFPGSSLCSFKEP